MAIRTPITEDAVRALLTDYDIGALQNIIGISEGVENTNYHLFTDDARYILTLYEGRTDLAALPFFHEVMRHFSRRAIPCPLPIAARDGATLKRMSGKPCAIIDFLEGESVTAITPVHCRQLGIMLARLHLAGRDFSAKKRANNLSLQGWQKMLTQDKHHIDSWQAQLSSYLQKQWQYLHDHWRDDVPRGIIHADVFPDNVFFIEDQLAGVIDFTFACHDALCYDFAIALNAWCFDENHHYDEARARALWEGYQSVRAFEPCERAFLPVCLRGSALRFLLTRLQDWHKDDGRVRKNPQDYLTRLRFHEHHPIDWAA